MITGPGHKERFEVQAWSDEPDSAGSVLLYEQAIDATDFPERMMPFEFWLEDDTMLLKEER